MSKEMPWTSICLYKPRALKETHTLMNWSVFMYMCVSKTESENVRERESYKKKQYYAKIGYSSPQQLFLLVI